MGQFEPYSPAHWVALVVVLIGAVLAHRIGEHDRGALANWFALLLLGHEALNIALHVGLYGYALRDSIPLNICRANMLLCAYMVWRRSFGAFEIAYFWAVVGAPVALFVPDLSQAFPHPLFFTFFVGHGLALLIVVYAIAGFEFTPRLASVGKSFAAALLLAVVAIPVNTALDTNYLYLAEAPQHSMIVQLFEPWPGYLVGIAAFGLAAGFIAYLPFAGTARRSVPESRIP